MYACIDLGSNSFHLLIAEWSNDEILLLERCSEKVQLGSSFQVSGEISPQAYGRGLECLEHFQTLISHHGVERYWALGTNTFRIATNADRFVQAASSIGIDISIISGVQEAILIYAGVISALKDNEDNRLVIDIGGGSTEIIVGKKHKRLITYSLPVGCVAWKDGYFGAKINGYNELARKLDQATLAAKEVFESIASAAKKYGWINVYASSGTAKMLTAVCQRNGNGNGNGKLTLVALRQLRATMLKAIADGLELPGLKEKRRDLLLPGYAVMSGFMMALECEAVNFSARALREGMLGFMVNSGKKSQILEDDNLPDVSYAGS